MSWRTIVLFDESDGWVRHTHDVIENLDDLEIATGAFESSARGFILTGAESYMASFDASLISVERSEAIVRHLTVDNPVQQRRLPLLETVIRRKIESGRLAVHLRNTRGLQVTADALPGLHGQQIMSEFQSRLRELRGEEFRLLAVRYAESKRRRNQTRVLLGLGILACLLITAASGWSVRQDNIRQALAENVIHESEERFRVLANNISQLAWMADENGFIFWYNQRWFDYSGTTLDEMAGWGWQKVHHPDHVQAVADKMTRCFQSGEIWQDTFPLRGRDGQYRWFLSRGTGRNAPR